jgi:hypothetical protein
MGLPRAEREQKIVAQVLAGNVPDSLRRLVPVSVESAGHKVTFFATPDYLSVGSDDDSFLTPLSPDAAQRIADSFHLILPTSRMVDAIYEQAAVKLAPAPIPPSPAMTTVEVFLRHNGMLRNQRAGRSPGALVAGHKKDVVIANKVFKTPGKVAIYGWHRLDGKPIQPLYTGHADSWVDYSHGIRFVSRRVILDGVETSIETVLADPKYAELLSSDGPMAQTRYPRHDGEPR